jgi:hypothetical protein
MFSEGGSESRVQRSRAVISAAVYPCHRRPPARAQAGGCRSSTRSRFERRNPYCGSWHSAPGAPDYVRYGPDGPARCELNDLTAFRARRRVPRSENAALRIPKSGDGQQTIARKVLENELTAIHFKFFGDRFGVRSACQLAVNPQLGACAIHAFAGKLEAWRRFIAGKHQRSKSGGFGSDGKYLSSCSR